ncbi:MAG: DNA polymerase III subunit delta [Acidimicrobiales bacterium]
MLVHLLSGDDEALLSAAVQKLVDDLVGTGQRSEILHELHGDDYSMGEVVDACNTMPFLSTHRVVVARGVSRFDAESLQLLVQYLEDPLDSTRLVLEWGSGRVKKVVADAVKAAGGTPQSTSVPGNARGRTDWMDAKISVSGIELDRSARNLVADHLGQDLGRLVALLEMLGSIYGAGASLGAQDVEAYLGAEGAVPPWDLTDPIEKGDIPAALNALSRMIGPGEMHSLQIMSTLHRHYEQALRLDGLNLRDDKAAAQVLGLKGSTFPAKKAMARSRRLGGNGISRAYELLSAADLDLRGGTGLEDEMILEILVARLCRTGR